MYYKTANEGRKIPMRIFLMFKSPNTLCLGVIVVITNNSILVVGIIIIIIQRFNVFIQC